MPQPVERLEKTLARVAKEQGVAQERLRRWVSFLALCGVLERAVSEGILDNYDLKGGVALELRFAEGARATKDIDIGVPVERTKRLRAFQDAVALGFDDFTFLLKGKPLNMDKVDAVRLELAIRYRTRAWQTIDVDLGPSGRGAVELIVPTIRGLAAMGLRVPSPIRLPQSERTNCPKASRLHRAVLGGPRPRRSRHSVDRHARQVGREESTSGGGTGVRGTCLPMPFRRPFRSQRSGSQSLKRWRRSLAIRRLRLRKSRRGCESLWSRWLKQRTHCHVE